MMIYLDICKDFYAVIYDTPKKIKGIWTRLNNCIVDEQLVEKQYSKRIYQ